MTEIDPLLEARAARGERAALEELLCANLPVLEAYVRLHAGRRLQAKASVRDLVQTACRHALEDLAEFKWRGAAAFRHWLSIQALRAILRRAEHHRAAKRDPAREQRLASRPADEGPLLACYATFCTPSRELIAREALARVEHAMSELSDEQREALLLHRLLGLPHAEVARALGKTELATRSLVARATARLAVLVGSAANPIVLLFAPFG